MAEGKMERMRNLCWIVIAVTLFIVCLLGTPYAKDTIPPKKTPELLSQGKKLYEQNCITCHGSKGDGKGQLGAALKPVPSDFTKSFKQWTYAKGDLNKAFEVISKGIPNTSMVKWDQLSEQERWALAYVIVDFSTPPKTTPVKKTK
jgi:mono/diheme cytochrome c family protein